MNWSAAALLFLLLLLPPPCAPDDRLALDRPLSVGTTIVSAGGGGFALGFVSPTTNSTPANNNNRQGSAVLLDTGNLVIRHPNDSTLWQSFEHPADSFLPGMKLRVNYRTRASDERLVSWSAPDDPSPGSFTYGVDTHTALQLYLWNGTRPLMRDGPWTGYSVASRYQAYASVFVYQAVVSTIYLTYTLSDGAARTRFVVTAAGQYRRRYFAGRRRGR